MNRRIRLSFVALFALFGAFLALGVAGPGCAPGSTDTGSTGVGGAGDSPAGGSGRSGGRAGGSVAGNGGDGETGGASGASGLGGVAGSAGGAGGQAGVTAGASGAGGPGDSGGSADAGGLGAPPDAPAQTGGATGKATVCINADGPEGQDTYALLEAILGPRCIENPDDDHTPPFRHVKEETDPDVGHHFAFHVHRDDSDMGRDNNKNRLELKVNGGANDALKGTEGETLTYTWRFKMAGDIIFSPRFNAMFQMKSFGGNAGLPLINIKVQPNSGGERLLVEYIGDGNGGPRIVGSAPLGGLKGVWLEVLCRAELTNDGSVYMTIKKPDGSTVITVDEKGVDMWRQGEYIRPKWGLYRGKAPNTRDVEIVRFANIGITAGPTPDSDCRPQP